MCRLINSDVRESFAAKLRNKSLWAFCRVLPSENTLLSVHTLQSVHKNPRGYPVRFQQWFLLQEVRTNRKSVRMSVLGGTPAPREHHARFNNSMRSYTDWETHRQSVIRTSERNRTSAPTGVRFEQHWFSLNTHRRYAGSYFYFCGSFSFPLISTLASWHARSTNTDPAETYVHISNRKLRLKNSIRNKCLRMVVQYYIFL